MVVKNLRVKYDNCLFHDMRPEDLLLYSTLFCIDQDDLRNQAFEIWEEKRALGQNFEIEQLSTLISKWYESRKESEGFKNAAYGEKHTEDAKLAQGSHCSRCGSNKHRWSHAPFEIAPQM